MIQLLQRFKTSLRNTRSYATIFRLREEYRWHHKRPERTPLGFNLIADSYVQAGHFEEEEMRVTMRFLPRVDLFVDIGANIGLYTCLARSRGVNTVAFEPEAQNLRTLYRNLALNEFSDTEVWPVGLAERPGLARIYGANTGASFVKGWAGADSDAWSQFVPVNTLDNALGSRFDGKQLLIKLDVEGAEMGVLQGARRVLQGSPKKPIWIVEISRAIHRPAPNPHFAATFELFWEQGYKAHTSNAEFREVGPGDIRRWTSHEASEPEVHNWCFVPETNS